MLSQVRALLALITAIVVTAIAAILTGVGGGGTGPGPTTTTTSSSSTTSSSTTATTAPGSTTSTTTGSTTSTTTSGSTTTTTVTGPPDGDVTLYTRVRMVISSQAQWFNATLTETHIEQIRVASRTGLIQVTGLGPAISVSGTGTAEVDMVLRIEEGAQPVLKTCKNWLGPASVALHRLTDGDVTIANLNNDGTSGTVPPGGCENAREVAVSRTDLIGPTRWPARADDRRLVLSLYYPWWTAATSNQHFGDDPVGPVDTSDPAVVAEAVDLAAASGIDAFVVEYAAFTNDNARTDLVYDAAAAASGDFQVALFLDFDIVYGRDGHVSAADIQLMLNAVARWADEPAQLEKDGQPVVFLYGSNRVDVNLWASGLSQLTSSTGLVPFFIDQQDRLGGTRGGYAYGNRNLANRAELFSFADAQLQNRRLVPGLNGQAPRLWVHPIQPGYDDTRLGRTSPFLAERNDGQRYQDSWDAAQTALPDWILVSTWNEYGEQTHVMPGDITGDRALQQTAAFAAAFRAEG